VDCAISSKFDVQTDLKIAVIKTKAGSRFATVCPHLENSIWRHNFAMSGPVWMKFDREMLNHTEKTVNIIVKKLRSLHRFLRTTSANS